ncbi:Hypothetical predicted protein [Octopus vulgaris]|uniref:Uncharacterized protein n=1 Tax=Octopus vulgaris TaxID=6645 RepID=A0AA36F1Z0_OCTVU|nr:Hypothetical predicted protein [Octopus vulgaris]
MDAGLFLELKGRYPEDIPYVSSEMADKKLTSPADIPMKSSAAIPLREKDGEAAEFVPPLPKPKPQVNNFANLNSEKLIEDIPNHNQVAVAIFINFRKLAFHIPYLGNTECSNAKAMLAFMYKYSPDSSCKYRITKEINIIKWIDGPQVLLARDSIFNED